MAMAEDITGGIAAAETRRCAAMLASDAAALDLLLDARLSFSHATGQVDDKAAYLAKMAAGRIDYLSIDWSEQQVIALGHDAALLTADDLRRAGRGRGEAARQSRARRLGAERRRVAGRRLPVDPAQGLIAPWTVGEMALAPTRRT